jgi:hypothetical protein
MPAATSIADACVCSVGMASSRRARCDLRIGLPNVSACALCSPSIGGQHGRQTAHHSFRGLNSHRSVRRGFLPRGLCDTCPQFVLDRHAVVLAGRYLTTLNRSVSTRLRQEADFQCVEQAGPRAGVSETREFTLPAICGRTRLTAGTSAGTECCSASQLFIAFTCSFTKVRRAFPIAS